MTPAMNAAKAVSALINAKATTQDLVALSHVIELHYAKELEALREMADVARTLIKLQDNSFSGVTNHQWYFEMQKALQPLNQSTKE